MVKFDSRQIHESTLGIIFLGSLLVPMAIYTAYTLAVYSWLGLRGDSSLGRVIPFVGIAIGAAILLFVRLPWWQRLALAFAYIPISYAVLTLYALVVVCSLGIDCL